MEANSNEFLPTRWSLLSRLKDWDDQASWREFFDTYWRLIYSTAIKAGLSHTEAEEVVQETIISVAKHMAEFKANSAHGSFKSWLMNLTRWRITDQLRKRANVGQASSLSQPDRPAVTASDETSRTATIERIPDPATNQLEAEWDAEWERNLLHAALERVKSKVRPELYQMFDLLANKGWPASKVADGLQVSLARVYYAKYKVIVLLKREIRKLERRAM
jgi:RNA polymerase sigma-70 factor (ECF subfamily)